MILSVFLIAGKKDTKRKASRSRSGSPQHKIARDSDEDMVIDEALRLADQVRAAPPAPFVLSSTSFLSIYVCVRVRLNLVC